MEKSILLILSSILKLSLKNKCIIKFVMPIAVEAVTSDDFLVWLDSQS